MNSVTGWKILTNEFRPPIRGGDPVFGGTFPYTTQRVDCDSGPDECSYGWNFVRELESGFRIAGFWPTGRPNVAVQVNADADSVVERGGKLRAGQLRLVRFASTDEIRAAIHWFSKVFGAHQDAMAEEQWLWYEALGRPKHDRDAVVDGLREALRARQLEWTLKEFPSARAARVARDAPRAAWVAWDALAAWAAWDARDARAAWVAWDALDAWDAWDARDALTLQFAARFSHHHDKLTAGIRESYKHGLAVAAPTGPSELGWAMESAR